MKYRALCPCCGDRLSRSGYFRPNHQCPACGSAIRPEPRWNQTGNTIGGIILTGALIVGGACVAVLGSVGWAVCIALVAGVLGLGWVLYPYCTPYEMVRQVGATPPPPPLAAPAPSPPSLPAPEEAWVLTRVPNRVSMIPPEPRYGLMTAVGVILAVVSVGMWAALFKCPSACRAPCAVPAPSQADVEQPPALPEILPGSDESR